MNILIPLLSFLTLLSLLPFVTSTPIWKPPKIRDRKEPFSDIVRPKRPWNFKCTVMRPTLNDSWPPVPEEGAGEGRFLQRPAIPIAKLPLKIHYVLAESTSRENEFIMRWAFLRANLFLTKRIKSPPMYSAETLRFMRSPVPQSNDCKLPEKCSTAYGVRIPMEYLQPCWTGVEKGVKTKIAEYLKLEATAQPSTVVYVRVTDPRYKEPNKACTTAKKSPTQAYTQSCQHSITGRAHQSMIVICVPPTEMEEDHLLVILLHETMHVLTSGNLQGVPTGHYLPTIPVGAAYDTRRKQQLENQTWRKHTHEWKQKDGSTKIFDAEMVMTPTVKQVVKDYFRCYNDPSLGAEVSRHLNDQGAVAPDGAHWNIRLFPDELLSPMATGPDMVLSNLTLAALQDTGWYEVNMSLAMRMEFDASKVLDRGEYCHVATKGCDELLKDAHKRSWNVTQWANRLDWIGAICDRAQPEEYRNLVTTHACSPDGRLRYECYISGAEGSIITDGCSIYIKNASMDFRGINCPNQLFKRDEAERRIGSQLRAMCVSYAIYQASYWDNPSDYWLNRAECLEFNCTPETKSIDLWLFPSNDKPCKVSQVCGANKPAITEWTTSYCRPPYWGKIACPVYENICEKPGSIGIPFPTDPPAARIVVIKTTTTTTMGGVASGMSLNAEFLLISFSVYNWVAMRMMLQMAN